MEEGVVVFRGDVLDPGRDRRGAIDAALSTGAFSQRRGPRFEEFVRALVIWGVIRPPMRF